MTLQTIDPRAEVGHDGDQVAETARQRALDLARAGLPLNAREFALILGKGLSQFHKQAKRGAFEDFLLRPAFGPKRYSGVKVQRYLAGEVVDGPTLTFGRRKRA